MDAQARCLATGTFPNDLPALAVPAGDAASADALAAWLMAHRDEVRAWLAQYGAVLLRGFALRSADCFGRCMVALGEPPMPYLTAPQVNGNAVAERRVWFNQVVVFHSSLFQEFARHGNHGVRWFLRMRRVLRRLAPAYFPYPYDAIFGDGSTIDDRAMGAVRDAHWRNETFFRWQAGDLLLIDNLIVGHGRQPFRGPRRVLAALRGSISP